MHYHAHVYWSSEGERETALSIREGLKDLGLSLGRVWDVKVGPHPLPMYQVNYSDADAPAVEGLLSSSGLNVLLHEDTGDDLRDHTEGARWLGDSLDLDLEWLRAYAEMKSE